MSDKSKIEWTDATWNPIRGCSRVSEGCRNCYAEGVAARFSGNDKNGKPMPYKGLAHRVQKPDGTSEARWTGKVKFAGDSVLVQPLRLKKPRRIFVNSMSDLFHEGVPFEMIDRIFAVMALCPQHTFQLLTKRPERIYEYMESHSKLDENGNEAEDIRIVMTAWLATPSWRKKHPSLAQNIPLGKFCGKITWPLRNLQIGVSVENQATAHERIPLLLETPAAVRFVSAEPLLGHINFEQVGQGRNPINIFYGANATRIKSASTATIKKDRFYTPYCNKIDWIIVGGESGKNARPMHSDWARSIRDQCEQADVPFFFKQWGEWVAASDDKNFDDSMAYIQEKFGQQVEVELHSDGHAYAKVGKKRAGRLLDGIEHNAMPQVQI